MDLYISGLHSKHVIRRVGQVSRRVNEQERKRRGKRTGLAFEKETKYVVRRCTYLEARTNDMLVTYIYDFVLKLVRHPRSQIRIQPDASSRGLREGPASRSQID